MKRYKEQEEIEWSEIMQVFAYVIFCALIGLITGTILLIWLSFIYGKFII